MELQKRLRGGRTYYYLTHSYRVGRKVRKLEKYLGAVPPRDLTSVRFELLNDLFAMEYRQASSAVGTAYRRALRKAPAALRDRNLRAFATQFTYDSNRIEGSTLSLRDTALLLQDGITPADRPLSEVTEALAHRTVFLAAIRERGPLTLEMLLRWHRQLFAETKPEIAGKVREHGVRISQSRFIPPGPFELAPLLQEFFEWHRGLADSVHPVLRAALVHLRLVTIHPFGDGNGRVTRIVMNRELALAGFPLFNIEYRGRRTYYNALERSQVSIDEVPFVRWFARRYLAQASLTIPT